MKSPHTEIADKILKTIATQRETVRKIVSAKDKINAMTFKEIKHAVEIRGKDFAIKALKKTCKKL